MKRADWVILIVGALWAISVAYVFCGCAPLPPVEPTPPVDPGPPPVEGTACERSCERRAQLACAPALERCVEACERYEAQGLAFSWQPECQATTTSCDAWDACATGAR